MIDTILLPINHCVNKIPMLSTRYVQPLIVKEKKKQYCKSILFIYMKGFSFSSSYGDVKNHFAYN